MEQMLIKNGAGQLYAVYHEPKINRENRIGVVLCYPYGQEYIRCHKLYVDLATRLATQGYHVLQFDYCGTGNSSEEFSSVTIEGSVEDIRIVVNNLLGVCNVSKIVLGGVRFGATLAILYSMRYKVDSLFLWNPVMNGHQYLNSIDREYENWLRDSFAREGKKESNNMHNFGFIFSSVLVSQIKAVSLLKHDINNSIPILLIDDKDQLQLESLENISFRNIADGGYWRRKNEMEEGLIPIHELSVTMEWLKNQLDK